MKSVDNISHQLESKVGKKLNMKTLCYKIGLFLAIIGSLIRIKSAQAQVPDLTFTFDDTDFSYFKLAENNINWVEAETECKNWGGHLASIGSVQVDSLLYYTIEDIQTHTSCFIGLNDRGSEAGTNADAFVWVDGSNSNYRHFGNTPGPTQYPIGSDTNDDCVRLRYKYGTTISNGWLNGFCDLDRNCYFCNKPATPSECDLIYNGFCYRLYEVSDGINWLDAQSSCAVWGGDLTSITTERVNNYLYTIIPDTVSNCWIGLNDRSVEGTYTWIDGSVYSYTNWTGVVPSGNDEDCVETITTGEGNWETVSCEITINAFLCKRPSSVTTGASFGELINEGLDFQPMSGNTFLYQSLTLACGGDEDNAIVWNFSENSNLSNSEELTATYNSTQTGFSWLDIYNTRQGYYQCQIDDTNSYTIGLFNQTTTISVTETTYSYTVGIDREDVLLLCDPMDSSYSLSNLIWSIGVVLLFTISASLSGIITAQTPNISLIYNDTTFGYFIVSPINWPDAEVECNNWGGNLATINSAVEDSLLFYSAPEPEISYVSCYIGLNDRDVHAGTDASAFVWVDGSANTYTNFGSFPKVSSPSGNDGNDCVRFRYKFGGVLSSGWINRNCTFNRDCYFCTKPGNSQGCDLIYDGSCYRLYEVSTGINWLDAQSSCAVWGGDLTSITTERENNYLYTIIPPATVSNCWIGLNDRDNNDGTYTWIDGSVYSHTNWTGNEPSISNEDCVDIIRGGEGSWRTVDCVMTRNAFLCKRPSSVTTAGGFGQLSNGRLDFETISENTFLFTPHTLAYGGEENIAITWIFSENSDLSSYLPEIATYENMEAGWSWLAVDITKQGYYQCQANSETYTIGLYDPSLTTIAVEGQTYIYIVGVDRDTVLLLCNPTEIGSLSTVMWDSTYNNPIHVNTESATLPTESTAFSCMREGTTIVTINLSITVPEMSVHYGQFLVESFSLTYPSMNLIDIALETKDVSLSINLEGKWTDPEGVDTTSPTLVISEFMQADEGMYTFYTDDNWNQEEVIAMQIKITSSPALTVMDPEEEFTFGGTTFGYFTNSPSIDWLTAQLSCILWGGNLATITSEVKDDLLYYSITDIQTYFRCYIGLNDILVDAGTNGSAFVWVDGSTSTYRNFGTLEYTYPRDVANFDCVRFRYKAGGTGPISDGWINLFCNTPIDCHFCTKPATPSVCDLIYEGSCYRIFDVSTRINWLDAQSSCAVWGGDLTSITTERENNYLYTIIMSNNYWIGLNDRSEEGTYTWTDGATFSYANWTNPPSNDGDCIEINTTGGVSWETVNCEDTINTFVCKRASTSTVTIVGRFGELINERFDFQLLNSNTFLFTSRTLACGGEQSNNILWNFSENSDLSDSEVLTATYSSTETGLSWLAVDITKQGYYQCQINSLSYAIGLYDPALTTVAISGTTYNYTVGVDRQNVLLLCDPMDSGSLSALLWSVEGSVTLPNPFNIYKMIGDKSIGYYSINCSRDGDEISKNKINSRVPQIILQYGDLIIEKFSSVYPVMNNIEIPIGIKNISIPDNIEGRWMLPDGSYSFNTVAISTFTSQNKGVYKLYITNWDGQEVCAIQINITETTDGIEEITNFNISLQVNYTVGSINDILYYSNSEIPDTKIRWTTDSVNDGETKEYSIEYPNPVLLSAVFTNVGTGIHGMTSFYRMSPITLLGSLQLAIKDTVEVTISYEGYNFTTSDISNELFPSPKEIEVPVGTKNVQFTCNIPVCIWKTNLGDMISPTYIIPMVSEDNGGNYSLVRNTSKGVEYTTALVYLRVTPQQGSSISPATIAIPIILIVILACIIIITILLIFFVFKIVKGKRSSYPKQHLNNEPRGSPIKSPNVENESRDNFDYPKSVSNHGYSIMEEKGTLETNFTQSEITSKPEENVYQQSIEIAYEDITEVLDPRMAPIPLDVFKQRMDTIWKKEGALLEEYESLGGKTHRYSCKHASIEENKVKNRFKLIYPYDKSRVILTPQSGNINTDYVNASKIPGFYVKESFIAAQGPKENTLQDFWQMIIENNIANIVMVTNLVESGRRKCEAYFPLKIGKKVIFGPYEIMVDNEEVKTGYTIRMMSVQSMGKIKQLKHFHFTAWPDHDVPTLYDELLLFVSKVHEGLIKTKAPVLVHCSAGVGRSGTFLTLYNLFVAIVQTKPISIYSIVHQMREHRPQMVQTFAQYKFIYLSVLEILLGSTSTPTREFADTFDLYMQSEYTGYVSVFFQQFSELNYQCEKAFDPVCVDAIKECNSGKNPIKDILPSDSNRVVLYSPYWEGDYINASSLDNGEIILTIHPLAETLRDFYQLIYQMEPSLVIMLCSKWELQLIEQNKSQRVVYWPKFSESFQTDSFKLTCEESEKLHYIRNKISLQHMEEESNKIFTQIIANCWNDKGEPDLKKNVLVLQAMLEFHQQFPLAPIIIHCQDGAGMSGVLYTVYKAIKNSREKGFIDIFHIVKKLRNERMNSVTTLNHFLACYTLMNEYCQRI
ncbi:hypothetical protein LOD99_8880 [Oopsacas minuta]|uniref:protein-tyrosine-phosphatase n=1 Tax=Oopsacas minuta TaxID=111878 RepID=A0AAV7JEA4_9METZ|nr:hypothetical protein LOD99_8880 [Oopsacas minuta]